VPGIEHAITSNEIFDLPQLPKRLLIIGGGYIAVEFASLFARLGVTVSMCMRADNILRGFDEDMRTGLREAMVEGGVSFHFGALPLLIEKSAGAMRVTLTDGGEIFADQVMIATGRKPHTNGLGLENAGVVVDELGAVKVDAASRSTTPSVYAVGDVTNRLNLTPVAIREAHAFADSVFGDKPTVVSHDNVPTAVFTTPEIGTVGMSEHSARLLHDVVDIYRTSFRPMKTTLSGRAEKTIMKLVVDGKSDKMLGVHILGHEAGEMAQTLGIAIKMGATKADFDATMAVHPTAAEELVTLRTRTARHTR
jgi:glutathione reductase (NADPH)